MQTNFTSSRPFAMSSLLRRGLRILSGSFFSLCGVLLFAGFLLGDDNKIDRVLLGQLLEGDSATAPMFVVFQERADLSAARTMGREERGRFVIAELKRTASSSQGRAISLLRRERVDFTAFWVENKIYVPQATLSVARTLAEMREVVALISEEIFKLPAPEAEPATLNQTVPWNVSVIAADQVWNQYGTTGQGLVVANIDSGVQFNHPALVNQYRGNTGSSFTHPGNWYDPYNQCTTSPCDQNSHGTHTMGSMVGNDGGSNLIGVAPGAKWIACRGCSTNSCSGSALIACAQWVLDPYRNNTGDGRPDVVNNSWGGGGGSTWYQSYINSWRAAGIFPAFSNGNSGPGCSTSGSPGDNLVAFSSGATSSSDSIARFSSRGPSAFQQAIKPDISAPGVSVRSSVPTNSYSNMSGTSMASPHTAGAVALLWATQPALRGNIAETERLLRTNADWFTTSQTCGGLPAGSVPNNTYGYGRLNVKKAADAAGGPVDLAPVVTITQPQNGAIADCDTIVTFSAEAVDAEDGNLSTSIQWSFGSGVNGGSGASISRSFSCSQTGFRQITAFVIDSASNTDADSITINIVDPNVLNAPSNLTAQVPRGSTSVLLRWQDNSDNETGFVLERRSRISGNNWTSWVQVSASISANSTSYTDSPGSGTFEYRIFAARNSTLSMSSNVASAKLR
jgi:subtilisin family serine protease